MYACEHEDVVPDLVVSAKGLVGGLPLSAVTGRAEIMDAAHVGGLGGTCGGNPLACGAALPVFVTIREEGLLDRAAEIEKTMKERLTALQTADPRVGEVRGRGAMVAVEIVRHDRARPKGGLRFSPDVASTRFARWRCG